MDLKKDDIYMAMALELAEKGRFTANPNPMVGAVIVVGDKVVARGWHKRPGTPHAEAMALDKAGDRANGSTLYVSLEPCCHKDKRTPPCTDRVIKAGVSRVVIAMSDPNPKVNGKGIKMLRDAGLDVKVGTLRERAEQLNRPFSKYITAGAPYVTLKVAQTLDGKIATSTGESKWITGPESRQYGHMVRNRVDAIMVGIGTIMKDDPSLTTRVEGGGLSHDPHRIILDSHLRIPLDAKVLNLRSRAKTYVATTVNAPTSKMKEVKDKKAEILIVDPDETGRISFPALMDELAKLGMLNLLIEGGARVNASALRAGVVDRALFFIAPKILGGDDARGSIGGGSPEYLDDAINLNIIKHTNLGRDILIEGIVEAREGEQLPAAPTDTEKPARKKRRRRRPSSKKKGE